MSSLQSPTFIKLPKQATPASSGPFYVVYEGVLNGIYASPDTSVVSSMLNSVAGKHVGRQSFRQCSTYVQALWYFTTGMMQSETVTQRPTSVPPRRIHSPEVLSGIFPKDSVVIIEHDDEVIPYTGPPLEATITFARAASRMSSPLENVVALPQVIQTTGAQSRLSDHWTGQSPRPIVDSSLAPSQSTRRKPISQRPFSNLKIAHDPRPTTTPTASCRVVPTQAGADAEVPPSLERTTGLVCATPAPTIKSESPPPATMGDCDKDRWMNYQLSDRYNESDHDRSPSPSYQMSLDWSPGRFACALAAMGFGGDDNTAHSHPPPPDVKALGAMASHSVVSVEGRRRLSMLRDQPRQSQAFEDEVNSYIILTLLATTRMSTSTIRAVKAAASALQE